MPLKTLTRYRNKRDLRKTPEPSGTARRKTGRALQFVVQKHWATRLHYDLRLEHGGVLKSWAVPRDPPVRSGTRRLAVLVEDHPLDYGTFKGTIPPGNYGAGTVIIWDKGSYRVTGSAGSADSERRFSAGFKKGRLDLELDGMELKGTYVLVRMAGRGAKNWLLVKKRERAQEAEPPQENPIIANERSERTVESRRARAVRAGDLSKLDLRGAVRRDRMPLRIEPMTAALVETAFDRPGWIFEIKWDGYRAVSSVRRGSVAIYSRRDKLLNDTFPEIAEALRPLSCSAIFDGEIVALDRKGRPDFSLLQNYLRTGRGRLVYYVFDILYLNGYDLRPMTLLRRKAILSKVLTPGGHLGLSYFVREGGISFFRAAAENGFEGIMAKDGASPYREGVRSGEWLKIKVARRQEAVICGFTAPRGSREYFGALVLGVYDDGDLRYIGNAGGGFDRAELKELRRAFEPLITGHSPFGTEPDIGAPVVWLRPELVCEVRFSGWTRAGCMRQPVFIALRQDKRPEDVRREIAGKPGEVSGTAAKSGGRREVLAEEKIIGGTAVRLTKTAKVFWPAEGYTKGDVIAYYRDMSPVLLPYLKDRPENLNRHPDGIRGKSFIQKDVDDKLPLWVPTASLYSETDRRSLRYLVCQNEATLALMANLGCIEINPWNSRTTHIDRPDYLVLDLDPLGVPFKKVVEAALAVRSVLDEAEAESFCKTSGATGMHVYVPLGARYTYEQAAEFARIIALLVHERLPDATSIVRDPARRDRKVYLDHRQNAYAQTVAAAYSIRPRPGAPVSAPLSWSEVGPRLDPSYFTMTNIRRRLDRRGDLWRGVLGPGIDMEKCIERLEKRYAAAGG